MLLLLALGTVVRADESAASDPTPAARAEAVVAAGEDATALASLAAADHPDPWRVIEILLRRGRLEVARRFAGAATAEGTAPLAKYVARYGEDLAADVEAARAGGGATLPRSACRARQST